MGIWDDPWCCLAAKGPTRLPPEPVNWSAAGVQLVIIPGIMATQEWIRFIQTGWSVEEARQRLSDAKILMCRDRDNIRGTCVLRQRDNWWILETLRADVGYGSIIMRGAVRWLWDQTAGSFQLTFLWEISHVGGLVGSIYRGWWRAVRQIRWGWIWRQEGAADCGWCAGDAAVLPWRKRPTLPVILKDSVVVTDSGLKDGCGYVLSLADGKDINWSDVADYGGWRTLWYHGKTGPRGWKWSGECILVGVLNSDANPPDAWWPVAEVASSLNSL